MSKHGPGLLSAGLAAALVVFATAGTCIAATTVTTSPSSCAAPSACACVELARAEEAGSREAHSHHDHDGTRSDDSFNDEYVFGLTRGIADSTMHPAAKILVFPMTVPLDLAFLPFEVIAGLF